MAKKITVSAFGGQDKTYDEVSSLQQLVKDLDLDNPSIRVNGETASINDSLPDYAYVSFGTKVKGGQV